MIFFLNQSNPGFQRIGRKKRELQSRWIARIMSLLFFVVSSGDFDHFCYGKLITYQMYEFRHSRFIGMMLSER